jgi:NAD(P)-dependent dehydrogenase (short-subunit alcohol dehydrogenase family)
MGIGLEVAQTLAANEFKVVLVARGEDALRSAAKTLTGGGHSWQALDVADESGWDAIELDRLDGLVCAAAVLGPIGSLEEYAVSEFRRTFDVNVVGTLLAIRHCLPALRRAGGAIVTFSGGGATTPLPRYDAYACSKAAVVRLTENLAQELAPVKINCVAPGFIATKMHDATLAAGPGRAGAAYYERTVSQLESGAVRAAQAAELVHLLLSGVPFSGKLVSVPWDPWRDASFRSRLASESWLGTLRRVDDVLVKAAAR